MLFGNIETQAFKVRKVMASIRKQDDISQIYMTHTLTTTARTVMFF